jgi:hypothetical protein
VDVVERGLLHRGGRAAFAGLGSVGRTRKNGAALYFKRCAGATSRRSGAPLDARQPEPDLRPERGVAFRMRVLRRRAPPFSRMLQSSPSRVVLTGLVALALPLAARAATQSPTPFGVGERWGAEASSQDAWLPLSVSFAAAGELCWSATQGAQPRLELFDTAPLDALSARRFALPLSGVQGVLSVASGRDPSALFALAQFPGPSAAQRWTQIARYDARSTTPAQPVWTRTLPLAANGAARVLSARSSAQVLAAVYDQTTQVLALEWLSASAGVPASSFTSVSGVVRPLVASRELERVAFVAGAQAHVVARGGGLEHLELLSAPTHALAISGDGSRLALGDGARVRVLARGAGAWSALREFDAATNEVATRVALSDDGATLAIGWWDAADVRRVRFELWRTDELTPRYTRQLAGASASLQNFPESVLVTPDGRRAAFGAWGSADSGPEAFLVDATSGAELLALDLAGSVRAAALDESGTRLALGVKHGHANLLGATGGLRLFDTGERELQLISPAVRGASALVAARRSGARRAYLIGGPLATNATPFGSAVGGLWIARQFAQVWSRPADSTGRADFALPVPALGFPGDYALQAYFRGGGAAFSNTLVQPVVR